MHVASSVVRGRAISLHHVLLAALIELEANSIKLYLQLLGVCGMYGKREICGVVKQWVLSIPSVVKCSK